MNEQLAVSTNSEATRVRYVVLGWFCSLSMLTYIDRVCIKQVSGELESALSLTSKEMGLVFAAFGLAYALFEVPSGWLGDLMGPRKVLCRIVLWWSLFTALTGFVYPFTWDTGLRLWVPLYKIELVVLNGLTLLLLIRFLFGMGEAGAYPNTARALRNWFPYQQRGLAQGLLWSFGRWGGAIAPLLIGVGSWLFGWRGSFLAFGVIGAVWVVVFYAWFRDTPREHPAVNDAERAFIGGEAKAAEKPARLSWRTMLASPTLWCLSLMYFCSNAGWSFFITWDVRYYQKVLHLSDLPLRLASGAPLFFGGIACLIGGFMTDRQVRVWGRRWGRTLQGMAAYALASAFFFLALLTRDPWLAVPALCLASFLKDFAMAVSWSSCIDIGHRYSGTVSGFMNMVGNLGTFVTPPFIAWMVGIIDEKETGAGPFLERFADLFREFGFTGWQFPLIFSGTMFFLAALGWAFINPRRVIVYSPDDRRRLHESGALE